MLLDSVRVPLTNDCRFQAKAEEAAIFAAAEAAAEAADKLIEDTNRLEKVNKLVRENAEQLSTNRSGRLEAEEKKGADRAAAKREANKQVVAARMVQPARQVSKPVELARNKQVSAFLAIPEAPIAATPAENAPLDTPSNVEHPETAEREPDVKLHVAQPVEDTVETTGDELYRLSIVSSSGDDEDPEIKRELENRINEMRSTLDFQMAGINEAALDSPDGENRTKNLLANRILQASRQSTQSAAIDSDKQRCRLNCKCHCSVPHQIFCVAHSRAAVWWSRLLLMFLLLDWFVFPIQIAWVHRKEFRSMPWLLSFTALGDVLFLINCILLIGERGFDGSAQQTHESLLQRKHVRALVGVGCMVIYATLSDGVPEWVYFLPLSLRVLRFYRLLHLGEFTRLGTLFQCLWKTVFIIASACHWFGCVWYAIAALAKFDSSTWLHELAAVGALSTGASASAYTVDIDSLSSLEKIIASTYWGLLSICNGGYSGAVPGNLLEVIYTIFMMFVRVVLYAFLLATVYHQIASTQSSSAAPVTIANDKATSKQEQYSTVGSPDEENADVYESCIIGMAKYAKARLAKDAAQVIRHFSTEKARRIVAERRTLARLPVDLRIQIAKEQFGRCLEHGVFVGCSSRFKELLLLEMMEKRLVPNESLFLKGDFCHSLCFVMGGSIEIRDGDTILRMVHPLDGKSLEQLSRLQSEEAVGALGVVGEMEYVFDIPCFYSARAGRQHTTICCLPKYAFTSISEHFSHDKAIVTSNAQKILHLDGTYGKSTIRSGDRNEFFDLQARAVVVLEERHCSLVFKFRSAATNGRLTELQNMLASGLDINAQAFDNRTALHCAARAGCRSAVEFLLQAGAETELVDSFGFSFADDPEIDDIDAFNSPRLAGPKSGMRRLYEQTLHSAILQDRFDVLQNLLAQPGTDIDATDYDRQTALHIAIFTGSERVAELLVQKYHCDVNVVDRWGRSSLFLASSNKSESMVMLLKGAGATITEESAMEILTPAVIAGDIGTVQMMVEVCQVSVNASDSNGRTILHIAAMHGCTQIVGYLIAKGVDFSARNRIGYTALDEAAAGSNWLIAKLLEHEGAPISDRVEGCASAIGHIPIGQARRLLHFCKTQPVNEDHKLRENKLRDQLVQFSTRLASIVNLLDQCAAIGAYFCDDISSSPHHSDSLHRIKEIIQHTGIIDSVSGDSFEVLLNRHAYDIDEAFRIVDSAVRNILSNGVDVDEFALCDTVLRHLGCYADTKTVDKIRKEIYTKNGVNLEDADQISQLARSVLLSKRFQAHVVSWCAGHDMPGPLEKTEEFEDTETGKGCVRQIANALKIIDTVHQTLDVNHDGVVDRADIKALCATQLSPSPELYGLKLLLPDAKTRLTQNALLNYFFDHPSASAEDPEFAPAVPVASEDVSPVASQFTRDNDAKPTINIRKLAASAITDVSPKNGISSLSAHHLKPSAGKWANLRRSTTLGLSKMSGKLGLDSSWKGMKSLFDPASERSLRQLFDVVDADKSGSLSINEVEVMLNTIYGTSAPPVQISDFLKTFDTNNDGIIDWPEFMDGWKKTTSISALIGGAKAQRHCVIMPSARWLQWWRIITCYCVLYYLISIPFRIVYFSDPAVVPWWSSGADYVIDFLFIIDMVIKSFTCYVNKNGQIIVDPQKTFKRYLHTAFPSDLLATIPLDIFSRFAGASLLFVNWCRIVKLPLRFVHLLPIVRKKSAKRNTLWAAVRRSFFVFSASIHIVACAWYYVVQRISVGGIETRLVSTLIDWSDNEEQPGWWSIAVDRYALSLYYVSCTISAAHLPAEFQPSTIEELVLMTVLLGFQLSIGVFVVCVVFDAVILSQKAKAVRHSVANRKMVSNKITPEPSMPSQATVEQPDSPKSVSLVSPTSVIDVYMAQRGLSKESQDQVENFHNLVQQYGFCSYAELGLSIYDLIPTSLFSQVARGLTNNCVHRDAIFHGCSTQFHDALALKLHHSILGPGMRLFCDSDMADEIYFVIEGSISVSQHGASYDVDECKTGALGAAQFFLRTQYSFTAYASATQVALICGVSASSYAEVISNFADDERIILVNLEQADVRGDEHQERIREMAKASAAAKSELQQAHLLKAICSSDMTMLHGLLAQDSAGSQLELLHDIDRRSMLHHACAYGNTAAVAALLRHGAPLHGRDRFGFSAIDIALLHGQTGLIQHLNRCGASVEILDIGVQVCQLAADGNVAGISQLIEAGACDVHEKDHQGRTMLHLAAAAGAAEAVEFLIGTGANALATDFRGATPLRNALENQHSAACRLLADWNDGLAWKWDIAGLMCESIRSGDLEGVKMAVELGAPVFQKATDGQTALHVAVTDGSVEMLAFLIKCCSPNLSMQNSGGKTALDAANDNRNQLAALMLKQAIAEAQQHGLKVADIPAHATVSRPPVKFGEAGVKDKFKSGSQLQSKSTKAHRVEGITQSENYAYDSGLVQRLSNLIISSGGGKALERRQDCVLLCHTDDQNRTLTITNVSDGFLTLTGFTRSQLVREDIGIIGRSLSIASSFAFKYLKVWLVVNLCSGRRRGANAHWSYPRWYRCV
jgi:ankyrin repeat protein/CRP-like cAMP-binding protein